MHRILGRPSARRCAALSRAAARAAGRGGGSRLVRVSALVGAPLAGLALYDLSAGPVDEAADLPRAYDADAFNALWARRPLRVLGRGAAVLSELVPLGGALAVDAARGRLDEPDVQLAHAVALRVSLVKLGPAFIKLGQALSIRPDVLPGAALVELQKLVDSCPAYPDALARATVAAELGASFDALFDATAFGCAPVAAASLGQVYRVTLRETGEVVAVKVQRPDMAVAISLDLTLLALLARAADAVLGALTAQRPYHAALLRAFATASWAELDYEHEASNQERFRAHFGCLDEPRADAPPAARGARGWLRGGGGGGGGGGGAAERARLSSVYIPRVYRAHSSRRVLTTEWVQGEYLARSSPAVIGALVPVGVACFLRQLLEFGLFHADPHPGNLLVTPDGRLALIDFGLCAQVPAPDTARLSAAIVHTMAADTRLLVDDAIALGFLPTDVDRAALAPLLRAVLRSGTDAMLAAGAEAGAGAGEGAGAGAGAAAAPRRGAYGAVAARRRHFSQISDELNAIFFKFPFQVPDYFALITRALVVLEGIALTGDADFDILESAFPWVARHAARELRAAGGADGGEHVFAATRLALGAVVSPERAAAELAAKLAA